MVFNVNSSGNKSGVTPNMISENGISGYNSNFSKADLSSLNKKVDSLNYTVEYINNELMGTFFRQGLKFGIFKAIEDYRPSISELINILGYPNKEFVEKYVKTGLSLNLLEFNEEEKLELNSDFRYSTIHPEYNKIISDHVSKYDFMAGLVQYAFIGYNHPEILLNVKKDADIWDMMLNTNYMKTCREVVFEYLGIKNGDSVLEVGCGSRSPLYFASKVAPNGEYTGVDISKKLIRVAEGRLKRSGIQCATLKSMDFSETISKYKHDYVLCIHTLSYANSLKLFLKKMMESLKKGGKLVIMEEFFTENINTNAELFEFYNHLNKYFKNYVSRTEILKELELIGIDYKYELLGNNCIVVERI
ncbi:class I SAM-dependent methyltransferase [Methanococcus maripaludis]|uniref:Ubiquinone/menaquinone biosynthesis C-methylase UbiE n=2 Tax=Methanococcus maripaludis TaxID=39152 RepID=A0A7J9PEP2_METMI|nr:class I SAM-dependent methyltransferase [Methanococcus maripaludis]MBA2861722.1 ubiquinone/menaquinone biosynthesis C-methylase UbiE [Methanococcus maripaludis]